MEKLPIKITGDVITVCGLVLIVLVSVWILEAAAKEVLLTVTGGLVGYLKAKD